MNRSHYLPHTAYTISPYQPRLGAPAYQPMPAAALPPAPFSQSPIAYPPTTYNQSMPVNMMQPSHSSNQWAKNVSPFGAAGYTPMAGQVEDIIGSPPPGSLAGAQSPQGMGITPRMPMSMASMQALSMTTPLSMPMPMPMPVMHHPHPHPSSMPQVQDVFARPSQPQQQFTTAAPPSFHQHQQRQSFEQQQQQQQQLQQQYQQQQEQQQYNTHVGVNGAYPPLQTSMMQSSPGGRAGRISGNSPLGINPPQRPLDPATVLARPRYEEYSPPPPPPPPTQQQMQASNTPSAVFSSFMSP